MADFIFYPEKIEVLMSQTKFTPYAISLLTIWSIQYIYMPDSFKNAIVFISAGKAGDVVVKRHHKKKKRRVRLPKNYEPGVPPDPERWLPRRERTGYRGKRRDKRDKLQRGPQGVTTAAAPELWVQLKPRHLQCQFPINWCFCFIFRDMGKPVASLTSTPPNPAPANTLQRKPQPSKPHKNKKGKKR